MAKKAYRPKRKKQAAKRPSISKTELSDFVSSLKKQVETDE